MKRYKKSFLTLSILIIIFLSFSFLKTDTAVLGDQDRKFTINGNSMQSMFLNNEEVFVDENYYKENVIKRNDIVLLRHSANENFLIKIVKATDEDFLEIKDVNLLINGKLMKNSEDQTYSFQTNELKMLGLYIKDGYLPKETVFVFGDNISDSKDSRNFGAVPENYILYKVN
ncbi:MAG: signal peptidase I [Patescibacteria group bacterium]|nr:signal peptidase I [Patescibacteria group bacterium]